MVDLRLQRPRFNEDYIARMLADAPTGTLTVAWIILLQRLRRSSSFHQDRWRSPNWTRAFQSGPS